MSSSGVDGFNRADLGCRWVHPGSLRSLVRGQPGGFGIIAGLWVHSHTQEVVGFILCRLFHSRAHWGSSWVVGFTNGGPGCCWIHSGSLSSLAGAYWIGTRGRWVFSRAACVSSGSPWIVVFTHAWTGSLDSLAPALDVLGFIRGCCVRSSASWWTLGSSGVARYVARRGGRWIHPGLLGSPKRALGVFGFSRCRCVQSRTPCGSFDYCWVVGFIRARRGCR